MIVTAAVSEVPAWVVIVSSMGSGAIVGVLNYLGNRRLRPAQEKAAKLTAEQAAVGIVETALRVAQERITGLEAQISRLTIRIEELRDQVKSQQGNTDRLQRQLDLALTQRAQLQQQLIDLSQIIGEGRAKYLADVRPPDAVVIVSLKSGMVCYANDGIFGLFGYAPQEVVGQPLEMLVPEASRSLHTRQREEFAEHPRQRSMGTGLPLFARRRDGVNVPVDISLHPTGDGRIIALVKHKVSESGNSETRKLT